MHAIGIEPGAKLLRPAPDNRPRVLFHGDSITHGHGVTSPRETYVSQVAEKIGCVPLNYGFGGTAWADNIVAQTIAARETGMFSRLCSAPTLSRAPIQPGKPETAAQYARKYDAYLTTIRAASPTKPILCITPILNRLDLTRTAIRTARCRRRIEKALAASCDNASHRIKICICSMVCRWSTTRSICLSRTPVHPNDLGMHRIAEGVAAALKPLIATLA